MNYVVVDMEWNQPFSKEHIKKRRGVKLVGEIIQIGAVKLDENKNIIDKFEVKISPQIYTVLQYMVKKVTGLSQKELRKGVKIAAAIDMFFDWCGDDTCLLTWGPNDIPILKDNLTFFGIDKEIDIKYYNAQCFFNQQTENKGRQFSIDHAMEYFGIENTKVRHNALNDAMYTALVLQRLDIQKGIELYDDHALYMDNVVLEQSKQGNRTRFEGYKSRSDAIVDKRIIKTKCPDCDNMLNMGKLIKNSNSHFISIGNCKGHGEYYIEFKIASSKSKNFCVTKSIRRLGENEKNQTYIKTEKKASPQKVRKSRIQKRRKKTDNS